MAACRVARFTQLNAAWQGDAFLRNNASRRPSVGFQAHYSAAHADAESLRERTRLAPNRYVAPTDKRRDSVRLEVRMRMQAVEGR